MILGVAPESYSNGRTGPDVWVTVEAHVGDFSASIASVVVRRDWDVFLKGLSRLEEARRGEVVLRSAVDTELRLRIFAVGSAGHVAVEGELSRSDVLGEPAFRFAGIEFDPTELPTLLRELRESGSAV